MKVLISTHSAECHSSFGRITRDLWRGLWRDHPDDLEIVQQGWFHHRSVADAHVPWKIIPTDAKDPNDLYGAVSMERVIAEVKPDVIWCLADAYMIGHLREIERIHRIPMYLWIPVDGLPYPRKWLESLPAHAHVYGVTEWGAEQLRAEGFVHHGCDPRVFKPHDSVTREAIRRTVLGSKYAPNAKVVGVIGKNQFRKMPWVLYEVQHHLRNGTYASPMNVYFWMHSFEKPGGITFRDHERAWGQEGQVIYTENLSDTHGLTDKTMNDLYNVFDLCVSFSGGEGFCMPLVEASLAGTRVLYTNYSGQAEVGDLLGGIPLDVKAMIPEHTTGIRRAIVDVEHATLAIHEALADTEPYDPRPLAERAFSLDVCVERWWSILQFSGVEKRMGVLV